MTFSLRILLEWAAEKAETDPDLDARPVWARIVQEITAYLEPPDTASSAGPDLFDEVSP